MEKNLNLTDLIERHKKNVSEYREYFKGKSRYDAVPASINAQIVGLIQDKTISKANGVKLLEYYLILHKIRMGIETEENVMWLIDFMKLRNTDGK